VAAVGGIAHAAIMGGVSTSHVDYAVVITQQGTAVECWTVPAMPSVEYREGVQDFLLVHPDVTAWLREGLAVAQQLFSRGTRFAVELFTDPEAASPKTLVFLVAKTELDPREAAELVSRFDREWWLANRNRTDGALQLTTEFV
jgi:hypothetical protein